MLHKQSCSVHLISSLKSPGLPFHAFFVLVTVPSGEKTCDGISSDTVGEILRPQKLRLCFQFRFETIFKFLLAKSKIQIICFHLQLFENVHITKFIEIVIIEFQFSAVFVLNDGKPDKVWFFVFNLCFDEFSFFQSIVHMF